MKTWHRWPDRLLCHQRKIKLERIMKKEMNEALKDKEPRREERIESFQKALEEFFEECGEE